MGIIIYKNRLNEISQEVNNTSTKPLPTTLTNSDDEYYCRLGNCKYKASYPLLIKHCLKLQKLGDKYHSKRFYCTVDTCKKTWIHPIGIFIYICTFLLILMQI